MAVVAERTARPRPVARTWFDALRGQPTGFLVGALLLGLHLLVAISGPLWAPYAPNKLLAGPQFASPSLDHLLGTDNFGRDVFSRLVHGERIVLLLAFTSSSLAVGVGSALALTSAYLRGWFDDWLMRITEVVMSIPPLILSLLVLGSLGSSYPLVVVTVAFFFAPRVMTVVRAAALGIVTEDFVTVARLRGESAWSIAIRELLPNVVGTVLVEFSLRTGYAVLFIGGLSFLGFGAAPPTPEWGLMINEGRTYVTTAPWSVLGPALALASLVVGLSLFTEGLGMRLGLTAATERGR